MAKLGLNALPCLAVYVYSISYSKAAEHVHISRSDQKEQKEKEAAHVTALQLQNPIV